MKNAGCLSFGAAHAFGMRLAQGFCHCLQIRPKKPLQFVKRNNQHIVVQIRMNRVGDNHQLLVVSSQLAISGMPPLLLFERSLISNIWLLCCEENFNYL
jgi:hypothetical protein